MGLGSVLTCSSQLGKTTLVKVLMGLYDHQGELLINDQPIERFSPNQIHARTTCCFQDHSKYSLTLRENVGIGNVIKIKDDKAIHSAIVKGGATAVEAKVGLEGKLNRTGVPDASLGGGEADFPTEAAPEAIWVMGSMDHLLQALKVDLAGEALPHPDVGVSEVAVKVSSAQPIPLGHEAHLQVRHLQK